MRRLERTFAREGKEGEESEEGLWAKRKAVKKKVANWLCAVIEDALLYAAGLHPQAVLMHGRMRQWHAHYHAGAAAGATRDREEL